MSSNRQRTLAVTLVLDILAARGIGAHSAGPRNPPQ
jgi:hypothetical protein